MAGSDFQRALARHLDDYRARSGKSRSEVAQLCGRSPAWLSGVLSGPRTEASGARSRLTPLALVRLIRLLGLTHEELNKLTALDGAPPGLRDEPGLTTDEEPWRASSALEGLIRPEQAYLRSLILADVRAFFFPWDQYSNLRARALSRNYDDQLTSDIERAIASAKELASTMRRAEAWLMYVKCAAEQHNPQQVKGAARATLRTLLGMFSTSRNGDQLPPLRDPALECMAQVRLGDLERLEGNFNDAEDAYQAAKRACETLSLDDDSTIEFSQHWNLLIERKLATLNLYRGDPETALGHLPRIEQAFAANGALYEQIRSLLAIGSAQNMLGLRQEGLARHERAHELTRQLTERRRDPWSSFEAELHLAEDHFELGDFARAAEYAGRAHLIASSPENSIGNDVDVGRLWVLRGRLQATLEAARFGQAAAAQSGIPYVAKALRLFIDVNDKVHIAPAYNARAELLERAEDFGGALESRISALEYAGPAGQLYEVCKAHLGLARVLAKKQKLDLVPEQLRAAFDISSERGYHRFRGHVAALAIALIPQPDSTSGSAPDYAAALQEALSVATPAGEYQLEIGRALAEFIGESRAETILRSTSVGALA